MEQTYFIRHSSALDVDKETLEALWLEDRVAIHYPHDEIGTFEQGDSQSLNPDDYAGHAQFALKRLLNLARDGGYIFATYRGRSGGKVGYILPGSPVELFWGKWGNKNNRKGRAAALKSLRMNQVRNLAAEEAISLTAVQPRQGTFCRWRKVGKRVIALAKGAPPSELGCLTPDLQEVMCMEYLRTAEAGARGLPVLRHTLMPVGRTMKDIDILGISDSGRILSAQVTYKNFDPNDRKLRKLDGYRTQGNETIYFCRCDKYDEVSGHIIFPLQQVFEDFCVKSEAGKGWFGAVMGVSPGDDYTSKTNGFLSLNCGNAKHSA